MTHIRLFSLFAALLFVTGTLGHSYLTKPQSRSDQKQTVTGCRGPACLGPCDATKDKAKALQTVGRGDSVETEWPRNNHAGGFIRFAWAKTSDSDSAASFDAGVEEIHCHEIGGCKPDDPSNPNGGDSAPSDGSVQPCRVAIKVPSYLTDGAWTLQWAWFGGAFALGDYYSCADFTISGGVAVTAQQTPVYYGGDYSYPGQNKCKFFNTDRLHRCVNEPCSNPVYTLNQEQSGPAFGIQAASANTGTTPAPVSLTTKAASVPPPVSLTTHAASVPMPLTTKSKATVPLTTHAASVPTPPPTPTPSPDPDTPCVLGYEECLGSSTYKSCYRITANSVGWSPARSCQAGLVCKPWMDHYVICDRP